MSGRESKHGRDLVKEGCGHKCFVGWGITYQAFQKSRCYDCEYGKICSAGECDEYCPMCDGDKWRSKNGG